MNEINLENQWHRVKEYYERVYKIKFKEKPSEFNIRHLFAQMKKMQASVSDFYRDKPGLIDKFFLKNGIVKTPKKDGD